MPGPAVPKALGPRKARDPIAGLPSGVALVASGELLGLSVGAKFEIEGSIILAKAHRDPTRIPN
jgi:hypothetical protein